MDDRVAQHDRQPCGALEPGQVQRCLSLAQTADAACLSILHYIETEETVELVQMLQAAR